MVVHQTMIVKQMTQWYTRSTSYNVSAPGNGSASDIHSISTLFLHPRLATARYVLLLSAVHVNNSAACAPSVWIFYLLMYFPSRHSNSSDCRIGIRSSLSLEKKQKCLITPALLIDIVATPCAPRVGIAHDVARMQFVAHSEQNLEMKYANQFAESRNSQLANTVDLQWLWS